MQVEHREISLVSVEIAGLNRLLFFWLNHLVAQVVFNETGVFQRLNALGLWPNILSYVRQVS